MLEAQGGVCAICRAVPAAHVDHDHATGEVRALLCFNCDGGLGQFRDDPFLLHVAAFYVEHHNDGKLWQGSGTRRPRYTRGPAGRVSRR